MDERWLNVGQGKLGLSRLSGEFASMMLVRRRMCTLPATTCVREGLYLSRYISSSKVPLLERHMSNIFTLQIKRSESGIFRKLVDNLRSQSNGDELKNSVKQFEEKLTEVKELDSVKKARGILEAARRDVAKQNEAVLGEVKESVEKIRKTATMASEKVGTVVSTAAEPVRWIGRQVGPYMQDVAESEIVKKVSEKVGEAEEKIIENTNIYQYGGFKTKEARERSKLRRQAQSANTDKPDPLALQEIVKENPAAGDSVVEHKTSRWSRAWTDFRNDNALLRGIFGLTRRYNESNNVFVYIAREITGSVSDRFAGIFAETETARAMREISARDPTFTTEKFMRRAREHILPEILDALLTGDLQTLRLWCSEGTFSVLKANIEAQRKPGYRLDGRVLDMRGVDILMAKLLDDMPVLVLSLNTQQTSCMRDSDGKIIEGREDAIELVHYVLALAKEPPPANPATEGWRLIEMAARDGRGVW